MLVTSFEAGSLGGQELTHSMALTDQQAPGLLLSLPLQHWDRKCAEPHLTFLCEF